MRAFITGATGFIGINLVRRLLDDGWQTTVLHRKGSQLKSLERLDVEFVEGDLSDVDKLDQILSEGFDAVFHLAGDISLWKQNNRQQDEVNIEGTKNLARLSLKHDVGRFIHTSSIAVWGLQSGVISEQTEKLGATAPINYMRSKYFGEQEVLACVEEGLDAVILNPSNVMGPYDSRGWSRLFLLIKKGQLAGFTPGLGAFCHVKDVVDAHVMAFKHGKRGQNYLLGGPHCSYEDLITEIAQRVQAPAPKKIPFSLVMSVAYLSECISWLTGREPQITPEKARLFAMDVKVDGRLAENHLQYQSTPLKEILDDSYEWLKAESYFST